MSDHDDTLLDEDLGDEEYNLGNEEEEALLADDNDDEKFQEKQQKGEEEADDILDLGVTDALDDLEAEEENLQGKSTIDKSRQDQSHKRETQKIHYESSEPNTIQSSKDFRSQKDLSVDVSDNAPERRTKIDLREKLRDKAISHRTEPVRNIRAVEDDDYEEEKERRNRFQNERVTVISKNNYEIPDTLENVISPESQKSFRKSEKNYKNDKIEKIRNNRIDRNDRHERFDHRNARGRNIGRYDSHPSGRFLPQPSAPFNQQQQIPYRNTPENWPPFQTLPQNNLPIQPHQHPYPPMPAPYHPVPKGPLPRPPCFVDDLSRRIPNQFSESVRPPIRINAPIIDYRARNHPGGFAGPPVPGIPNHSLGPPRLPPGSIGLSRPEPSPYNCLQNSMPYAPSSQRVFSDRPIPSSESLAQHSGPPLPSLPRSSAGTLNPPLMAPLNQGLPQPSQSHDQNISLQNSSSQPVFENRIKYPDSQFKTQHAFQSGSYSNSAHNQFNNAGPPITPDLSQNISTPRIPVVPGVTDVSNVPGAPPRHKILINPHFKGNPVKPDVKTSNDIADKFVEALRSTSNSHDNRFNPPQQKSDDPFSYFSDVWQESKSQRSQTSNSRRSFSPESDYVKSSSRNYDSKYKHENHASHRDDPKDHGSSKGFAREKESPPRLRNTSQNSNFHRHDGHSTSKGTFHKVENNKLDDAEEAIRPPLKRSTNEIHRSPKKCLKKLKLNVKQKNTLEKSSGKSIKGKEEVVDKEMEEYKKKMEEQKRLRERILKEKENRRKLAAMKNVQAPVNSNSTDNPKQKLVVSLNMSDGRKKGEFPIEEKRNKLIKKQLKKDNKPNIVRIVRTVKSSKKVIMGNNDADEDDEHNNNDDNDDDDDDDDILINDFQNNSEDEYESENYEGSDDENNDDNEEEEDDDAANEEEQDEEDTLLYDDNGCIIQNSSEEETSNKSEHSSQNFRTKILINRKSLPVHNSVREVKKAYKTKTTNANQQLDRIRQLLTSSQRVVMSHPIKHHKVSDSQQRQHKMSTQKSSLQERKKIVKSHPVKIENLANCTTESQIRQMCQGIGSIQSMQMGEGKAIINFKTQSAATAFYKKYQRKMLDLSLLKVKLIPQIASCKTSSKLSKNSSKK